MKTIFDLRLANHKDMDLIYIWSNDKLSRIKQKGIYDKTEDTVKDLTGYLILLLIALKDQKQPTEDMKNRNKPFRDHSGWFSNHT